MVSETFKWNCLLVDTLGDSQNKAEPKRTKINLKKSSLNCLLVQPLEEVALFLQVGNGTAGFNLVEHCHLPPCLLVQCCQYQLVVNFSPSQFPSSASWINHQMKSSLIL